MPFIKLTKFEQHRLSLFLACLVAATVVWLFFALSNNYKYPVETLLQYKNAPENKAFHPLQSDKVKVMVEGTGWQLLFSKFRIKPRYIPVDLTALTKKNFVTLNNQLDFVNKSFGSNQKIISVQPGTLYFDFSKRKVKRVPVKLISKILFKGQHRISEDTQLFPSYVILTGPEEDLKSISQWETDTLKLTDVDGSISTRISLKSPPKLNIDIIPDFINVKLLVDEFTEKEVEVPLKIKNNLGFDRVKLLPENVKVKLMVPIKSYENITYKSFEAFVDLNNWRNNKYNQLPVIISRFPEYCKFIKVEPQTADFIIQK